MYSMNGSGPYSKQYGYSLSQSPDYGIESGLSQSDVPGIDPVQGGMMAGAASANPYVLAATIGLGLLQQRAADERAKRQRAMEIEQQYGQNQNQALQNLNNTYARALKR